MSLEELADKLAYNYVFISSNKHERTKTYNLMQEQAKNHSRGKAEEYTRMMKHFDDRINFYRKEMRESHGYIDYGSGV